MKLIFITILFLLMVLKIDFASAQDPPHFSCSFDAPIFVDESGIYEAAEWDSKGFYVEDGWINLDSGKLKLKLNTDIQKTDIEILSGGEYEKGYQFSLENGKFIYVLLIRPIARTMTVTGACTKDPM